MRDSRCGNFAASGCEPLPRHFSVSSTSSVSRSLPSSLYQSLILPPRHSLILLSGGSSDKVERASSKAPATTFRGFAHSITAKSAPRRSYHGRLTSSTTRLVGSTASRSAARNIYGSTSTWLPAASGPTSCKVRSEEEGVAAMATAAVWRK